MKTYVFKINPNQVQQKTIHEILDLLKVVWNRGLALLEWRQYYGRYRRCLNVAQGEDPQYEAPYDYKTYNDYQDLTGLVGLRGEELRSERIALEFKTLCPNLTPERIEELHQEFASYDPDYDRRSVAIKRTVTWDGKTAYYSDLIVPFKVERSEDWEQSGNVELRPVVNLLDADFHRQARVEREFREYDPDYDRRPVGIDCYKVEKEWRFSCRLSADVRIDKTLGWEIDGNTEQRPVVNLVKPHWLEPPLVKYYHLFDLRKHFAKKRWEYFKGIDLPTVYVNDYLELVLMTSWERYLKGTGGARKPHYKRTGDNLSTIVSKSFKSQCEVNWKENLIRMPGVGWIKVRNLSQRMLGWRQEKILVDGSGSPNTEYQEANHNARSQIGELRQQLTEQIARYRQEVSDPNSLKSLIEQAKLNYKRKKRAIKKRIAALKRRIFSRDKRSYQRINRRPRELAEISSFKIIANDEGYFLHLSWGDAPVRTGRKHKESAIVTLDEAQMVYKSDRQGSVPQQIPHYLAKSLRRLTRHQQILSEITRSRICPETGKRVLTSKWLKQKKIVASIQRKIRAQRNGWQHWWTTNYTDLADEIILKEPEPQPSPRPDPKLAQDKQSYDPNGAMVVSNYNRYKLDAAVGYIKVKLTNKIKAQGGYIGVEENPKKKRKKKTSKKATSAYALNTKRKVNRRRAEVQESLQPNKEAALAG